MSKPRPRRPSRSFARSRLASPETCTSHRPHFTQEAQAAHDAQHPQDAQNPQEIEPCDASLQSRATQALSPGESQRLETEQLITVLQGLSRLPFGVALLGPGGEPLWASALAGAHLDVLEDMGPSEPSFLLRLSETSREGHPVHLRSISGGRSFELWAAEVRHQTGEEGSLLLSREITAEEQRRRAHLVLERWNAMGMLAEGLVNDFSSLLSTVVVLSDLIAQSEDIPAEVTEDCQSIKGLAVRGAAVLRRLLDFGQKHPGQPLLTDVRVLVDDVSRMFQQTLPAEFHLELGPFPERRWAMIEPGHLSQVLFNLLANGQEAMPGGGTLRLSMEHRLLGPGDSRPPDFIPHGSWLVVCIRDEGKGIEPSLMPRLFDPFYTTKPVGLGAGLGLPQALALSHALGGTLLVSSVHGMGTTAEVWVPDASGTNGC